jgi:iron(III) transport system substrate-binding protein
MAESGAGGPRPSTPQGSPRRRGGRGARVLFGVVVAGALGLSGCGAPGGSSALTLYNGQHVQTTDALVQGFERQTGITVNVRSGDEDTLADQIVTEGSHSPADLFYSENSPVLEYLQGRHLLAPVDASTLARTPARYNSPQGDWVGVSGRVSVLVYNTKLLSRSALPTSILELASPRYRGKVAIAPGETDFQPLVTSVLHAYGERRTLSWLEGLKENAGSHLYPDSETVTNDVNNGLAAVGVINQYYWYRLRAELGRGAMHSAIAPFAPRDPGYVIDVSGAAVLSSSAHRREAQRFLAYLVSRQGQEVIAHSDSFEYPLSSGVTTAQPETPFADLKPYPISVSALGDGTSALALLRKAGLL